VKLRLALTEFLQAIHQKQAEKSPPATIVVVFDKGA
jgi:hypothetical protein